MKNQKKIEVRGSAIGISFKSSDLVVSQNIYSLVVSQIQTKYPKNILKKCQEKAKQRSTLRVQV